MLDVRLALPDTGQLVGSQPLKVKCRQHNDKQASLAVYPDGIHCFGCNFHLDGEAAVKYLLKSDTVDMTRYTNESLDAYRDRATTDAKTKPLPTALADAFHTLLVTTRKDRLEWLTARGLTRATLKRAKVGHNGFAYTIPVFDKGGNLLTIRYRRDDAHSTGRGPKYWGLPGRGGQYMYPEWLLANHASNNVVVCEGELDALRLWQEGIPAVTLTNGAGQTPKLPALLRQHYSNYYRLTIATDMDEAGQEAARLTASAALDLGFEVYRATWDEKWKDVSEYINGGNDFNDAHVTRAAAGEDTDVA